MVFFDFVSHPEVAPNYTFITAWGQVKKREHERFPQQLFDIGQLVVALNEESNSINVSTIQNSLSRQTKWFIQSSVRIGNYYKYGNSIEQFKNCVPGPILFNIDT